MRFAVTRKSQVRYDSYLNALAAVIDDCLAFLQEAAQEVARSHRADSPGNLAVMLLVRHLIESIDGVSILVSKGSVQPCEPLLRSGLEALLSVNYILADDSDRRGLAFMVADIHRQLKWYRQCDPLDDLGKDIRSRISSQAIDGILGKVPVKLVRKKVAALKSDLADAPLKPIEDEWQRLKAAGKTAKMAVAPCPACGRSDAPTKKADPEWYSLFSGPKNIQQLAHHLKLDNLYELMYRHWSRAVHAANTMRNIRDTSDAVVLRPIRHPDGLIVMLRFSSLLTLPLALHLIKLASPKMFTNAKKRHDEICRAIRHVERSGNLSWKP